MNISGDIDIFGVEVDTIDLDKCNTKVKTTPINIINQFTEKLINNQKDLEPEYIQFVDENFWNLI